MAGHSDDLVSRLMMVQVMDQLRSYQGNLVHAVHVVEKGWLPDIGEPDIAAHLETLRLYLAANGSFQDDLFLLRLGLTVPGTQRGIVPPTLVLESNRGGFSKRRQGEAAGQITRLQEAIAIGRRFLPELSTDTQTAVAQLAEVCQAQPGPSEADWLEWFERLSSDKADELAARALACLDGENAVSEIGIEVLQHLACFRTPPLTEACCLALLDRAVFWPASLYRESGERIAERLADLIEQDSDPLKLTHQLFALAWTRSAAAARSFRTWTIQLPEWAGAIHVPPGEFLLSAGWCLDENGERRDLIASKRCFRLCVAGSRQSAAIGARILLNEHCPSCGARLVWLFDFSRAGLDLASIGLADAPTKILCCLVCALYGPLFSRYRPDGTAEFLVATDGAATAGHSGFQPGTRKLAAVPCPPFACAEPFSLADASTLAGVPMWLQDAEYPRCIECGRWMNFIAEHDNGPLGEEGIYYAFYCAPCRVSAVSFQQT